MKLGNLIFLSWKCLPSVPRAPHQERREKWGFTWESLFPLLLNYFELFDVILADMSLWIEWAGLLFGFGLNWWLKAISFHILTIVDHWVWRALAFSKFLGFWIWPAVDRKNGPLHLAPRAQTSRDVWFGWVFREIYAPMHVIVFLFPLFFFCTWVPSFMGVVADRECQLLILIFLKPTLSLPKYPWL